MTGRGLLTPRGVAAVAVIALERVPVAGVSLADARGRPLAWPKPGRYARARLRLADRLVDDVLVIGRDPGAELHVHGGTAVVQRVLAALPSGSAAPRPRSGASPTTVPTSLRAARALTSVRQGHLQRLDRALSGGLVGDQEADDRARQVHLALANARLARRLERPATVRIVGLSNAGKSTLFNALLLEDRALVSPEAGTTRDSVTALTQLEGVAVTLEDTEGGALREVRRPGADLLVHLLASPGEASPPRDPSGVPLIRVLGKVDGQTSAPGVSGLTGAGVPALRARIAASLGLGGDARDDVLAPVDSGLRQRLRAAAAELGRRSL